MNNDWIEWTYTDENPYPETLDTEVIVKFRDGAESQTWAVGFFHDGGYFSLWYPLNDSSDIIAYKVVSE